MDHYIVLSFFLFGIIFVLSLGMLIDQYVSRKKKSEEKDLQIMELQNTEKPIRQRQNITYTRKFFRVDVPDIECNFEFAYIGGQSFNLLKNKKGVGKIKDISAGGIKMICDYDIPLRTEVIINIEFELKNEPFSLKAQILRKEEHYNLPYFVYGMQFVDMNLKDEERLLFILNQIEIEQRKITLPDHPHS